MLAAKHFKVANKMPDERVLIFDRPLAVFHALRFSFPACKHRFGEAKMTQEVPQ